MKRSIIVVFIVILLLHLLGVLFLVLMQDDAKKPSVQSKKSELTSEPEHKAAKSEPEPEVRKKVVPPQKSISKKAPTRATNAFFRYKPIPTFDYRHAVVGNISAIPETRNAKSGILVDLDSGKVLWSKNAKLPVPIASMTKMMTVLLTFEDIRDGKIKYNQIVKVSKKAAAIGGSDIWLDPRESFPLKDLIKAILIKSANDAAYLVGETLGGGHIEPFVKRMNQRASELHLHAKYFNPHGLPGTTASKDNVASCEDLAKLAGMLLQYPEVVKISSTALDYIPRKIGRNKKTMLTTTNKLVRTKVNGVDGMKTGYTRRAGFCLTATCKRNGRRLVAVVTGFRSSTERNECVKKLLDWGYKR